MIVAILVALLVFGDGGWGFGGSGGGRPGGPGGTSSQQKGDTKDKPKDDPKVTPPKVDPLPSDETIKVTVLRGSAYPKSFRFEGYAEGVDLETAKNMLRKRLEMRGKLKSVTFLLHTNSTAPEVKDVDDLKKFVLAQDLDVTLSNVGTALP